MFTQLLFPFGYDTLVLMVTSDKGEAVSPAVSGGSNTPRKPDRPVPVTCELFEELLLVLLPLLPEAEREDFYFNMRSAIERLRRLR